MVLVQKWPFFLKFFFWQYRLGKFFFMIFQNEKPPFYAIKTRSPKSRKIHIFPKGLTHGFGPKMGIFQTFFFQAIYARKMSFMIFQNEKRRLQAIKARSPKRVNTFGKMTIFRVFALLFFIAQKGVLSFQNIIKDIFLAYVS